MLLILLNEQVQTMISEFQNNLQSDGLCIFKAVLLLEQAVALMQNKSGLYFPHFCLLAFTFLLTSSYSLFKD